MSELQAVMDAYQALRDEGRGMALATVVSVTGAACRRPGARLLVAASGKTAGCIGAGCMERDVAERARAVMAGGRAIVVRYNSDPETDIVWGLGLGCGGVTEMLIEPLRPDVPSEHLGFIAGCLERNEAGAMATVFDAPAEARIPVGSRLFLAQDGTASGDLGDGDLPAAVLDDLRDALRSDGLGRAREYPGPHGVLRALIEVIRPPVSLVVFGADQDAIPVAGFARDLGWRVTVVDSRAGLASAARFPRPISIVVCPPERAVERVRIDERTAAVIMMHQYVWDLELLRTLLTTPAPYIGILGPRQRTDGLLRHLGSAAAVRAKGRLHAPVGLDIGAMTSSEIALAIVGEIQAVLAGRPAGFLRDRPERMHPDA